MRSYAEQIERHRMEGGDAFLRWEEKRRLREQQEAARRSVSAGLANNTNSGWEKCRQEGRCRMCQRPGYGKEKVRNITRHHLVPMRWWKKQKTAKRILQHANANIVPLCEACHRLIDNRADDAERAEARRMLRRCLGSNEIAFILQVRDQEWFDKHYPK